MELPSAPGKYSRTDQDRVRKMIEDKFGAVFDRIKALELAPPPPSPSTCVGGTWGVAPRDGTIVDLSTAGGGTRTTIYNPNGGLVDGRRVYAGLADNNDLTTWSVNDNRAILRVGDGDDITWRGGHVIGDGFGLTDGTTPWNNGNPDDYIDHAAFRHGAGLRFLMEHFSTHNVGDGVQIAKFNAGDISLFDAADGYVFRHNAISDCHDDGFDNDTTKAEGELCQNFISAMTCISARPGAALPSGTYDASGKVMTLNGNLIWLKGMSFPDLAPFGGSLGEPCTFSFFKTQVTDPELGINFALNDNVFLWNGELDGDGNNIWGSLGPDGKISSQSNNLVLFPTLASGTFPTGWPSAAVLPSFSYLYGDAARDEWNAQINAWMAAHPEVTVTEPGLF